MSYRHNFDWPVRKAVTNYVAAQKHPNKHKFKAELIKIAFFYGILFKVLYK